jgi:single-strand DNA-binding protein
MNETYVTLVGWLGGNVSLRDAQGVPVASFRVASTPRRFQKKTESWVDGDTQWYSVNTWRALAENCADSLRRGDPVVVHGKLSAHTWTNAQGMDVTSFEVEAAFVGHDLNRGTSAFTRRLGNAAASIDPGAGGGVHEEAEATVDDEAATQPARAVSAA